MTGLKASEELRHFRHEARQPLNVITLTVENLRSRLRSALDDSTSAYAEAKLKRILDQAERLSAMLDALKVSD